MQAAQCHASRRSVSLANPFVKWQPMDIARPAAAVLRRAVVLPHSTTRAVVIAKPPAPQRPIGTCQASAVTILQHTPGALSMPKPSTAGRDRRRSIGARAIEMLKRYDCPMPYHAVCTHFLGR